MKINSKKVLKTCALSLALLMMGGVAFGPLTKTYAEEQGQQPSQEDRIVRIHFNVADKGYKVHIWYDGINGVTRRFDGTDKYGPYIDIKVEKNKPTLYFIIAVIDEKNNWGDKEYKVGDGKRTIDLTNKDISQIWVESGQDGYKLEDPSKPKDNNDTDWAQKIDELINKIDDLNISPKEKANIAIKLYEIKDRKGKRTEEDFKEAEKIFNEKAKEAEKENPGSGEKEISEAPTVENISKSSTKIKGRGVPGAKIEISYGYSELDLSQLITDKDIIVDAEGNWSVDKPSYIGIHSNEIIIVSQTEKGKKPNQTKAVIEQIKTSDFINSKIPNLKAKDLKVWKGDEIKWVEAYEIQGQNSDEYKFINDELKLARKRDLNSRTSEKPGKYDGDIEFTFRDGSKLKLSNTLYVTKHVVGAGTPNVPDDAVNVKMMLGEGVKVGGNTPKEGNKKNPVIYQEYEVKPKTNINNYIVEGLNQSIVKAVPLVAKEGYQNPKFKDENNGEDFVVTSTNNVFTAVAEKIPEKKEKTIIRIKYYRSDKKIDGWKVKIWDGKGKEYSQDFTELDKNGNYYAEVSLDGKLDSVSYKIINETTGEVEKNGTNDKDGKRTLKIDKNNDKTEATVKAKKPEVEPGKKPLVPSVKPDHSKSLDYKIVPEKKTEKKVKPSEKVRKSYKNLRISREKNVVAVKAAKLLLEIAPERVKDVKTNLINLIAKSESLVKNADTILEKLEAKYEF